MCGVVGMISLSKDKDKKLKQRKLFTRLLVASQARGTDATGVATLRRGKLHSLKAPKSAGAFIYSKKYREFKFGDMIIGHTRAKTQGEPSNNENNHPFITPRFALVHNGIISNDDIVAEKEKLQLTGECDSEVIARLIDKNWKKGAVKAIKKTTSKLYGSLACLMLDRKGKLYVFRDSNPIYLAYVPSIDAILIASDDTYFQVALKELRYWVGLFWRDANTEKYKMSKLPKESGIVFEFCKKGLMNRNFTIEMKDWHSYSDDRGYSKSSTAETDYSSTIGKDSSGEDIPDDDSVTADDAVIRDKTYETYDKGDGEVKHWVKRDDGSWVEVINEKTKEIVESKKLISYNPNSRTTFTKQARRFLKKHDLPRRYWWYDYLVEHYKTLHQAELDLDHLKRLAKDEIERSTHITTIVRGGSLITIDKNKTYSIKTNSVKKSYKLTKSKNGKHKK